MTRSRWWLAAPVLLYLLLAGAQALSLDGLQYDEALMVLGSVQMRNSGEILPLPQDPHTWTCAFGRCFPLMTVRYVGALKEYLTLPAMVLFGTGPAVVRLVSILWASLAVWGAGRFAGLGAAFLLALSPPFAGHTAFDNGAVAGWSGALGLALIALARFRESETDGRAFALGAAAGLGVWCRANFLWLGFAACVAAAPALTGWIRRAPRQALIAGAGAILGSLPFWIYQVISRGGTFEAVGMFRAEGSWSSLVSERLAMFGRVLIAGREHHSIWNGPEPEIWRIAIVSALFAAGLLAALCKGGVARQAAIALLIFNAFLLFSRLPVAEHHFVPGLPVAAIAVAAGLGAVSSRLAWLAAPYALLALSGQITAIQGIRATGGSGQWSDAISRVNESLSRRPDQQVRILDWGLQNNLFVLSDRRIRTVEDLGEQWDAKVSHGGAFLLNGPENTFFAATRAAFLAALDKSGKKVQPVLFHERGGRVFAELYEVPKAGGNAAVTYLDGFHAPEGGGARWTRREFSVKADLPEAGSRFELEAGLYWPEVSISRLGPVTLTASVAGHAIGSAVFDKPGNARFAAPLPAGQGEVRVDFHLNKALRAGEVEARELGVMVREMRARPLH